MDQFGQKLASQERMDICAAVTPVMAACKFGGSCNPFAVTLFLGCQLVAANSKCHAHVQEMWEIELHVGMSLAWFP